MKYSNALIILFTVMLSACTAPRITTNSESSALRNNLEADEIRIMSVVLDAAYAHSDPGWVLLAARTVTFACNPPANIGFDMEGCSGMRDARETSEERLEKVRKEIPDISAELISDTITKNQESTTISVPLPVPIKQVLYAPGIKAELKFGGNPVFAAYFSRPGFDSARSRALIYLGTVNWTDRSKSLGQYLYLEKQDNNWAIKDHAKVWELQ